ncbi:MAG: ParA family protein [Lachnospiraceae bacterium]|nr:ParA family protein [Lachnospiraceae bacterium]
MKVITITNRKGGTAKSETTKAIAGGLYLKGYKVLMIDLDAQANLTIITGAKTDGKTVKDFLNGDSGLAELIQSTEAGDIIAASPLLYDTGKLSPYTLQKGLKHLKDYDFILIDTAPAFSPLNAAAMIASDAVIVPSQADILGLQALKEIKDEVESVKEYNKALKILGVCITRYTNNRISKDMAASLKAVADIIGTKLYNTPIRENVAIKEAAALHRSIYKYAPRSNGAKDYMALTEEILQDLKEKGK